MTFQRNRHDFLNCGVALDELEGGLLRFFQNRTASEPAIRSWERQASISSRPITVPYAFRDTPCRQSAVGFSSVSNPEAVE